MTLRSRDILRVGALTLALAVTAGCNSNADEVRSDTTSDSLGHDTQPRAAASGITLPDWPSNAVEGAVVYVPVYSHIYHRDATRDINLAATLSVRNTDPERSISVSSIAYFDSEGQMIREYVEIPLTLGPMFTHSFVVEEKDQAGGVGANFLVTWSSDERVSDPIIQAIMISTANSLGLSFVGEGQVVRELGAANDTAAQE